MAAQPTDSGLHVPVHPVRIVTASSLFDGHDASINIMRRIMQSQGAEVVHLGHNRSVQEVVDAAVEEDVQGVAVSSYQGGHVEYFEYLVELLREAGAGHVHVVGGGGGVIVPAEIERLREAGVTIFSPEDGQRLGLPGMVNQVIRACDTDLWQAHPTTVEAVLSGDRAAIARAITAAETGHLDDAMRAELRRAAEAHHAPVLGITGTGGSGKSSLTDELVRRLRVDQQDKLRVACVAIDPTRRKGGGALLGDRIRMNSLDGDRVYYRSLATRGGHEVPAALEDVLTILRAAAFDLVVVETPGIGQGDAAITGHARRQPLRDDARVRRREPAREDRHARLRRRRRDQQVRAARRHGRTARRRPPAGAQPRGVRCAPRGHAGLRHLGRHLRRRRRHRPLPAPAGAARRGRAARGGGHPDAGRRPALHHPAPGGAPAAHPLPLRDRRDGARLPRGHRALGGRRPPGAAPGRGPRRARARREGPRRRRRAPRGGPRRPAARGLPAARRVVLDRRGLLGRGAGRHRPRQGAAHPARARVAVRQPHPPRVAAAVLRRR